MDGATHVVLSLLAVDAEVAVAAAATAADDLAAAYEYVATELPQVEVRSL